MMNAIIFHMKAGILICSRHLITSILSFSSLYIENFEQIGLFDLLTFDYIFIITYGRDSLNMSYKKNLTNVFDYIPSKTGNLISLRQLLIFFSY